MTTDEDPMKEQHHERSSTDRFFAMSDEEISTLVNEVTRAAVQELHDRGISTYRVKDGVMHETKPNSEQVKISDLSI